MKTMFESFVVALMMVMMSSLTFYGALGVDPSVNQGRMEASK
jgi:hypothetical protein